ncbi:MAG: hypothetical protein V1720_13620 [bacterium]
MTAKQSNICRITKTKNYTMLAASKREAELQGKPCNSPMPAEKAATWHNAEIIFFLSAN